MPEFVDVGALLIEHRLQLPEGLWIEIEGTRGKR